MCVVLAMAALPCTVPDTTSGPVTDVCAAELAIAMPPPAISKIAPAAPARPPARTITFRMFPPIVLVCGLRSFTLARPRHTSGTRAQQSEKLRSGTRRGRAFHERKACDGTASREHRFRL